MNNTFKTIFLKAIPFALIGIFFWFLNKNLYSECKILTNVYHAFPKALIYFFAFIFSVAGITFCLFSSSRFLRLISNLLFSLFTGIEFLYLSLNKIGLSYEDILLVTQNLGFNLNDQAFYTFKKEILLASLVTMLLSGLIMTINKIIKPSYHKGYAFTYLIAIISVYLIINNSQANRLAFPGPTKVPALIAYTLSKNLYAGPRESVKVDPITKSDIDHIIWVVDESVRSDHLGVNGYHRATTPFLRQHKSNAISLGNASSAAVCSDYSHYIMMTGAKDTAIPSQANTIRKSPLIFQYAAKANYDPILIYSPGYEDKPKGYLTKFDFKHIPTRIQTAMLHPELERYEYDFKSIDYLIQEVEKKDKTFTYFLKYGCHFHYEDAYPETHQTFTPTQSPRDWKMTDKNKLINSYDNAIKWSVDTFLEKLITKLKGQRYLVIYTSDHGQNILDHPDIKLTHCIKREAPKVMATVPMILLGDSLTINNIQQTYELSSKSSHFDIFPSTLTVLGYQQHWVKNKFGSIGLLEENYESRYYFSGDIFGRSKCYKNPFDN